MINDIPVSGVTGETVGLPVTSIDQTKYEIKGTVPNQHVMVANDDTVMTVNLAHRTQTIIETRTITVNLPSGPIIIPQVALLKRTQTTDLVTGQVTYEPWSTDHWATYDAPTVAGYNASPQWVAAVTVTDDTQDQTITINYQAIVKPNNVAEQTIPVQQVTTAAGTQETNAGPRQAEVLLAGLAIDGSQLALLGIRKKQRN